MSLGMDVLRLRPLSRRRCPASCRHKRLEPEKKSNLEIKIWGHKHKTVPKSPQSGRLSIPNPTA